MTAPYEPHRQAEGVNRADAGLRRFGRREGDAIMCPRCDGDGIVLRKTGWLGLEPLIEPEKCPECGGEGLDWPAMKEREKGR